MAIDALTNLDETTAVGILARAALYLEDDRNPAAEPKSRAEKNLREEIFSQVWNELGLPSNDKSPEALIQASEAIDAKIDALSNIDTESALQRLSVKGELPSDLFNIQVIPNIQDIYGSKFPSEREIIENTVHWPDKEQNYGEPNSPEAPFLISLFSRNFRDTAPQKSFTMLVAGQRNGLTLNVHQAWRIYPHKTNINTESCSDLVELLRRFSDKFGVEIEVGDQKGKLVEVANLESRTIQYKIVASKLNSKRPKKLMFTYFNQYEPNNGGTKAALAICINLSLYKKTIKSIDRSVLD